MLTRIVNDISQNPAAIGYAGLRDRQPGTKPVALAATTRGPYLIGNFNEVTSARFPLTRYIYIFVNRPPSKQLEPQVKEFLKYVLSQDGQKDIESEGVFLPLPARVLKQQRARLN